MEREDFPFMEFRQAQLTREDVAGSNPARGTHTKWPHG
jgi:hypothetical protein